MKIYLIKILTICSVFLLLFLTACEENCKTIEIREKAVKAEDDTDQPPEDDEEYQEDEENEACYADDESEVEIIKEETEIDQIEESSEVEEQKTVVEKIEEESRMKAIELHSNYFAIKNGDVCNVFGISEVAGLKKVETFDKDGNEIVLNDFFVKDEKMYFTVKSVVDGKDTFEYFVQFKETISDLAKLPTRKKQVRASLDNSEFSIKDVEYNGKTYQDVRNEKLKGGFNRFGFVDSYVYFPEKCLVFNATEKGAIDSGLYVIAIDRKNVSKYSEYGELF